jgi:cytochrome d ubiquinol oxidase subunit I
MFHILWPVLTIGLSLFLVLFEALWARTGEVEHLRQAKFWSKLFFLNVAVGTVTGIPMEFQFGMNWGPFSRAGGDVFGHFLGFEASMAFMLEATFLGVMLLGWKRVSPRVHLLATGMVALGASLSAFWIMDANSWMHTPTGGAFRDGVFALTSNFEAIFNPDMFWGVSHMWVACLEISAFVVGGVSAWQLLHGRHTAFFRRSFLVAGLVCLPVALLQVWLGDGSGKSVFRHQPAKLAAIEAHFRTNEPGEGAAWHVVAWPDASGRAIGWSLDIPQALSLLTTHTRTGTVAGLNRFPAEDRPPVWMPFYAFRVMIFLGFWFALVPVWTLWAWRRGDLAPERIGSRRALLWAWVGSLPLSYLAMEAGWVTREVGRQPWIIYGVLRTSAGATQLPESALWGSLACFGAIYLLLFVLFLAFARRIVRAGPESAGS